MANKLLDSVQELLKAAKENPKQFEELNKRFKNFKDKKLNKQDAHMGAQQSAGPTPGAGPVSVVKADLNGGPTAPSMSGPSNTMGAYGKKEIQKGAGWDKMVSKLKREGYGKSSAKKIAGDINSKYVHHYAHKAEKGETKHDRCVREVKQNSPEVKNPHAVCVAEGVKPSNWKKSESVEKALTENWIPHFMGTGQFTELSKSMKKKKMKKCVIKDEKNPDKEADAKLGEQVEHDVENHFKDNKVAEAKEGHSLTVKQEMAPKTSGHAPQLPKVKSFESGPKNAGLAKQAPAPGNQGGTPSLSGAVVKDEHQPHPGPKSLVPKYDAARQAESEKALRERQDKDKMAKPSLKKDWIKSEAISKALQEDYRPRFRK